MLHIVKRLITARCSVKSSKCSNLPARAPEELLVDAIFPVYFEKVEDCRRNLEAHAAGGAERASDLSSNQRLVNPEAGL